jgi:hypothetical protein
MPVIKRHPGSPISKQFLKEDVFISFPGLSLLWLKNIVREGPLPITSGYTFLLVQVWVKNLTLRRLKYSWKTCKD